MANWHIFLLVSVLSVDWSRSQSEVFKPPVILSPRIREDWYFSQYSDVKVNCSADAVPTATYVWTVNNQPVVQTPDISFDAVTGVLKIPSFTTREQATYVCTATNSVNGNRVVSYAAPSRLWQTRIEFVDEASVSQTIPEHSYMKMQCKKKLVIGYQIKYNWYSAEKTSISLDNYRLFIDVDGNLHFTFVVVNDQSLNYMCGISADIKQIILGTRNNVVVTPNSNISPIKPQAVYTNNGVKGMRFGTVKLECMFSGYDPQPPYIPVITWRDDSGKIIEPAYPKYTFSEDKRTLTITALLEEDEQTYTCEARNSAGEASAQVFLNVTSGPIFVNGQPTDQTVSQNTNVQFNCDTRSASREDPPSPPAWFINGQPWGSQIDPNKFELSPDNKILTIKNVTKPNDIMCVQCNVSNSEDSILANACLNVLLPIKIEKQPPTLEPSIVYGDNVDFTITASTDPAMTLSYRWEFNNKTYIGADHPPYMYFNPSTNLAYINTSSLSQDQYGEIGGTYRRVIYHLYDQKVVEINLILRDRQTSNSTTPAFTTGAESTSKELTTSTHTSPTVRQDFECHLSYMQVFIPAVLVPNSELTLRDPTCKLNNNGTHHKITFAYDECGTLETFYTDYVDIQNEISVHLILNDTDMITFVEDYKIPLQCSLDRSQMLNIAIQVEPRERIAEQVEHSADFSLKEYSSADYNEEITEYPVKVPLNREIFFEITLRNNSNSSLGVYVERCVATPSPDPNDTTHVALIDVGCSAHPAVKVQPATEVGRFRFSTQAFRFSGQTAIDNLVYIHCSVSTCGGSNCQHPCLPNSRRRRSARKMASVILTSGSHVVTS